MRKLNYLILSLIVLKNYINCQFFPDSKVINTCGYLETKQPRNANECKEDGEICCYVEVRDPENNNQKLRFCVSSPSHLVKDDIKDEVKLYTGYILDDLKCNKSTYLINDIMKILVFIIFMLL